MAIWAETGDGRPFSVASYALLTLIVAQVTRLDAGEFMFGFGDTYLHVNHLDPALPKLKLNPAATRLEDFSFEDVMIEGYDLHLAIKALIAI